MPLAPGTQLGPYHIVSLLGAGGMGEVYRAEDSRLRRSVAIKVLAPDIASPERIERFKQEVRAASALNHPNILTIHDVGAEGDIAYFAMEWVDGETLRDLLRAGPIPLRRTLDIAHQVAEGLAKAHSVGIVHRDLKPENVMVTGDALAKIVDFGLAKLQPGMPVAAAAGDADPTVTHARTAAGVVMGTIGYLSPEQASGRTVDYRSDQFALGLLMYELVTRTRPFERATTAQSIAATIDDDPAPIEALSPNVPPHLAAVVARCLAKDPGDRYESTRDLARDLKSIVETLSRAPVGAWGSRGQAVTPLRSRLLATRSMVAISAIVLVAAAASGAWLWRSRASVPVKELDRPRADLAFLMRAPDLEAVLEPLMQYGASSSGLLGESVRLRFGYVLGKRGESARAAALVAEAERIAREKIDAGNGTPALRIELAAAAVLRNDPNTALEWLARAHDAGYRDYGFLERDPILAELRANSRFGDIIDRMRKDVDAQRARAQQRGLLEIESLRTPVK